MKKIQYLTINSQSGECKLRKTRTAGPLEYVIKLELEIPDLPSQAVTVIIPVPATPAIFTEVSDVPYGITWALSEGIVVIRTINQDYQVETDITEKGVEMLCALVAEEHFTERWHVFDYMRKHWGLRYFSIDEKFWEKLFPPEAKEEG